MQLIDGRIDDGVWIKMGYNLLQQLICHLLERVTYTHVHNCGKLCAITGALGTHESTHLGMQSCPS